MIMKNVDQWDYFEYTTGCSVKNTPYAFAQLKILVEINSYQVLKADKGRFERKKKNSWNFHGGVPPPPPMKND